MLAEVAVVDKEDKPLRSGEPGEIVARGPMVMRGYWNRPDLTAEALRGGWMHTGDIGYFDEAGYLYVVDRLKDMIIPAVKMSGPKKSRMSCPRILLSRNAQ
jgi:long-chain acyl-CoA synthetase